MKAIASYLDNEDYYCHMNRFTISQFWEIIHFCAFSIVTRPTAFLSCKMSAKSFAKLMECAARKSNTTCIIISHYYYNCLYLFPTLAN